MQFACFLLWLYMVIGMYMYPLHILAMDVVYNRSQGIETLVWTNNNEANRRQMLQNFVIASVRLSKHLIGKLSGAYPNIPNAPAFALLDDTGGFCCQPTDTHTA